MAASYRLKQKPTDVWSIRERLALASSVVRSGDQNWVSVSRAIRAFGEPNRPADWFSQKNCALQYGELLEKTENPKRKRGERAGDLDTPGALIVRKLTLERIEELKRLIGDELQRHKRCRREIDQLKAGLLDDKLEECVRQINDEKRAREIADIEYHKWLKEREQLQEQLRLQRNQMLLVKQQKQQQTGVRKTERASLSEHSEFENALDSPLSESLIEPDDSSCGSIPGTSSGTSQSQQQQQQLSQHQPPSSLNLNPSSGAVSTTERRTPPLPSTSLLTSLLRSPTTSSTSPLRDGASRSPFFNTRTLGGNASSSSSTAGLFSPPRQQDATRSPISSAPTLSRLLEMPPSVPGHQLPSFPFLSATSSASSTSADSSGGSQSITAAASATTTISGSMSGVSLPTAPSASVAADASLLDAVMQQKFNSVPSASPLQVDSLEETIVDLQEIIGAEQKMEEQRASSSSGGWVGVSGGEATTVAAAATAVDVSSDTLLRQAPLSKEDVDEVINSADLLMDNASATLTRETKETTPLRIESHLLSPTRGGGSGAPMAVVEEVVLDQELTCTTVPPTSSATTTVLATDPIPTNVNTPGDATDPVGSVKREPSSESGCASTGGTVMVVATTTSAAAVASADESSDEDNDEDDDIEAPIPSPATPASSSQDTLDELPSTTSQTTTQPSSTTNSTTQELPQTTEKHAGSISTQQHDSSGDDDRDYKTWKKSIMLVWRTIANHRYANVFLQPVTDEMAPGYRHIVFRPMDLTTVKRNIENGVIRNTIEFQRDIMLTFQNAIMYNSSDHDVCRMAIEMLDESVHHIQDFVATQMMVKIGDTKALRGRISESRDEEGRKRRGGTSTDNEAKKARRSQRSTASNSVE